MIRKLTLLVVLCLAVSPLFASSLSRRYKNWPKTPEAYFMTNAEKVQWKQVRTNDEAKSFIDAYLARRGPGFLKEIQPRIAAADKYFSAGKIKGSETMRGRVVILFGPPSGISAGRSTGSDLKARKTTSNFVAQAEAGSRGREGGGSMGVDSSGAGNAVFSPGASGSSLRDMPVYSFTYDAQAAPKAIGKPFTITVLVYSKRLQKPKNPKLFEELEENVAEASIAKPEGATAPKQP